MNPLCDIGLIATRIASICADGLVLIITWRKTWPIYRDVTDICFSHKVMNILIRDGEPFIVFM